MSSSESENEELPVKGEEVGEDDKEEEEESTFADLGLVDVLCQACQKLGWKKPSKIQVENPHYIIYTS